MASIEMGHPLLLVKPGVVQEIRKMFDLGTEERLNEAIDIFASWVKKQKHFMKKDFSRAYLEAVLLLNKGSVEKSKMQLDKLCTMKGLLPKFFVNVNIKEEFQRLFSIISAVMLPKQTDEYDRILLARLTGEPFTAADIINYFQYIIYVSEFVRLHDHTNGFVVINDFRNVNIMDILSKLNLVDLQHFVRIMIECYGARIKSIHIVNDSKGIELFVKTLKQFLSPKIASRIFVHSLNEDVHKIVPQELLTSEYGGKLKSVLDIQSDWAEELSKPKFRDYMKAMNGAVTDETIRLKDDFNNQYIMGMPGSFRTMTLD